MHLGTEIAKMHTRVFVQNIKKHNLSYFTPNTHFIYIKKKIDANVCLTKMYLRIKFKSLICRIAVIDTLKKRNCYIYIAF